MGKNQHVIPRNDAWAIKGAGNSKVTKVFSTQKEAMSYGRAIAINQNSELIIHGKDGKIREKNSYGNDPRDIKG
ncbi:DUF2188 domain-containing protein [Cetobacterium sp.]|uniref:DUF2188 domain-containing protein n=1 Tax=Cetobacterium sp. TaxID=2071632 RepID=UPI003F324B69